MASLIEHENGWFYAQFYDQQRSPARKRVALQTRRRRTAERLLYRLEDQYALGEYDPWRPPEPPSENDGPALERIGEAREAYLDSCAHLRPRTVETYSAITRRFRAAFSGPRRRGLPGRLPASEAGPRLDRHDGRE